MNNTLSNVKHLERMTIAYAVTRWTSRVLMVSTVCLLAACNNGSSDSATPKKDAPTTTLAPSFVLTSNNLSVSNSGIADADGVRNIVYTLMNTATAVKTELSSPQFNHLDAGTYTLSARAEVKNGVTGQYALILNLKTTSVVVAAITPTVSFPTTSVTKDVGQTYSQVLVTNSKGKITYSSGNTAIATVDTSGKVTFVAPGSTVITASQLADGKYKATTASYTVNAVFIDPTPGTPFRNIEGKTYTYTDTGELNGVFIGDLVLDVSINPDYTYEMTGMPTETSPWIWDGYTIWTDGILRWYKDIAGDKTVQITIIATNKNIPSIKYTTTFTMLLKDAG